MDPTERPIVLIWEVTQACDLTWKHCRAAAEDRRHPDDRSGKCEVCELRSVCGWSRSQAFATTGDPLASDPLCTYVPDSDDGPLPDDQTPTAD
ncbi:MAG: hypothetical protein ACOCYZ_00655 [Halococcoides sp.]